MTTVAITLIGGPTALIELGGFGLLTDPTFDDPGECQLPHVTLRKTAKPALSAAQTGGIDAVLLSHDQHADNLDLSGRAFLPKAPHVFTTAAGAARLGGNAEGLKPWETRELTGANGEVLTITATPARHGPYGIEPFWGRHRFCALLPHERIQARLSHRRYRMVRRRCRGPAALPAWPRAPVCGRGADQR